MRATWNAVIGICALVVLVNSAPARAADDFSGKFENQDLSVVLAHDAGNYAGEIRMGKQQFPLLARAEAGHLTGSFRSEGTDFGFTATLNGDMLTFVTGGKSRIMTRATTDAASAVPHGPPSPGGQAVTAPASYVVVQATDFGKTVAVVKPGITTIQKALESTFPDLADFFGVRPTIHGAYEDTKSQVGGAAFDLSFKSRPVKGFVSCKIGQEGASVVVIYCWANAPKAEWDKLAAGAPAEAAATQVALNEYRFPDGTGSVDLAQGWTTNALSCMRGVEITGPADQTVYLGLCVTAVTPDSTVMQIHRQMVAQARQFGMRPPPPPELLVAPITAPAEALKNLVPQLSAMSQKHGGPATRLDKILKQEPAKAMIPGGQAALITFDATRITNGVAKQYRTAALIEIDPLGNDAFMLYAVEGIAPVETFDRDLPTMVAMAKSWRTNDQVVQAKTAEAIDAQNRQFAAQQAAHQEVVAAFDRYNRAWERRQVVQSRSFADFDEVIRGYRTVEDTATGYRRSVDLGNVHDIVNHLNEYNPGRYKEIPLRDEMYPLPGNRNR